MQDISILRFVVFGKEQKMKAVVQRVKKTTLCVDDQLVSEIPFGLTVFLGVTATDSKVQADYLMKKIANLRIFEDENGKMNLSVKDVGGEVLLVSQFTLYGDASHGNRPSFTAAARPEIAKPLYEYAIGALREQGVTVRQGVFGADMQIAQANDGPVTILLECENRSEQ
jgi:D-tyrosyl-tRNA(Tyr) deacylase